MKRGGIASILFTSLWPIAGYADGIDIPGLGVHIAEVPDGPHTLEVAHRIDGYLATLRIGKAALIIARVDAPVVSGSDIREASFRTAQRAEFYEKPEPAAREQATVVSGHDAWTIVSARRASGHLVNYRCVTYTVVDQHLYRLEAYATGQDAMPPEYEAAVHMMLELSFVPVDRSALSDSGGAAGLLEMPPVHHMRNNMDYYPAEAIRRGEEGVVGLEFSIDGSGHARDLLTNYYSSRMLVGAAQAALKSADFRVRPNWEANGYQKLSLTIEFQFGLEWPNRPCPNSLPPRIPGAEVVSICTTVPRRVP
jgi:hypothetical protein